MQDSGHEARRAAEVAGLPASLSEKRREEQKEKEIETRKRRRVDDVSSITGG